MQNLEKKRSEGTLLEVMRSELLRSTGHEFQPSTAPRMLISISFQLESELICELAAFWRASGASSPRLPGLIQA